MRFQPGQSGNPSGRPRGIRDRRTLAAETFMDENADQVLQRGLAAAPG